jgi:Bax protein
VTRFAGLLLLAAASIALAGVLANRVEDAGPEPVTLPDFTQWPAGRTRKAEFFAFLRPLLEAENARIRAQRDRLERLAARAPEDLDRSDRAWLRDLAREYHLEPAVDTPADQIEALRLRVDTVPVSLGLAQAAKESAWGTSRFAVEGNALFGQRCFEAGCGLVPERRRQGLSHEVRHFDSPATAVASYLRNLNTHRDYQTLRRLRAELRARGERVTGHRLAGTIARYSERRDAYIQEIRQMIHFNGLGPVDDGA